MEIFERVNGGTKLSRQQMRNALYSGDGTRWLKFVSEENAFVEATPRFVKSKVNARSRSGKQICFILSFR